MAPDAAPLRLEVAAPGDLGSLRLVTGEPRALRPGEVEIRVHAAALNFRDVLAALGVVPDPQRRPLGFECAGTVAACSATDGLRPGDEVVAFARGALATRVVTDAALVARVPPGLDSARAATLPVAFATAHGALHDLARVASGERVLVHSAAGGVGLAAVQLCHRAGARVLATAGTPEKRAVLTALGVEHVADSRSLESVEQLLAATDGEGVDVLLNALTGEGRQRSLALLRPGGRVVDLAVRDMHEDAPLGLRHFARGLSYHAFGDVREYLPRGWGDVLREVVAQVAAGRLAPLPHTEFDLGEAERAFRYLAQAQHTGKVVCTVQEPHYWVAAPPPPLVRPDGTVLVVGGLGGLGLATADWLVRCGVRHLVLAGRTGRPLPQGAPVLDALRRGGAEVVTAAVDASDPEALATLLGSVRATMPPLRGVVQAALALDDELLGRLDYARSRAVLAPKVAGAWALHQLTADDDLDLFVLYSSISSLLGIPAQGAYAAANAFLDALAAHRHARGLPAISVAWGAVAEIGYVARHPELHEPARRAGIRPIPAAVGFAALENALRRGTARLAVGRVDWSRWWPEVERDGQAPRPGSPGSTSAGSVPTGRASASHQPASVVPAQLTPASRRPDPAVSSAAPRAGDGPRAPEQGQGLIAALVRHTAVVLETTPERVDPARPLPDQGLDSLMAVELQTRLHRDLGLDVALVDLLEGVPLERLATAPGTSAGGRPGDR